MKLFSPSTIGFYDPAIHDAIPEDALEISDELYAELLVGQLAGRRIAPGADGAPILVALPPPSPEELDGERKRRLDACNDVVLHAYELQEPVPPEWVAYRQALRAIDVTAPFTWPTPPA